MHTSFTPRGAWVAAITLFAVALPAAPASAAFASTAPPACRGQHATPASGNLELVRRATLCLVNRERARRRLAPLRSSRSLGSAADRYARSMAATNFFDHVSPAGQTFVDRIRRSGFLRGARGYALAENLAWGQGALSTPRNIVRSWMRSPGHRANILNGAYRRLGVGVAVGAPVAGVSAGATYVHKFAARS